MTVYAILIIIVVFATVQEFKPNKALRLPPNVIGCDETMICSATFSQAAPTVMVKLKTLRSFRYLKLSLLAMISTILIFILRTPNNSHANKNGLKYDLSANIFRPMEAGDFGMDTPTSEHCGELSITDHDLLEKELREILSQAEEETTHKTIPKTDMTMTCSELNITYEFPDCHDMRRCAREFLPIAPLDRLESLLYNENLCITSEYRNVLKDMEKELTGQYDLIIISAVSSAHYLESQAMLKNLHEDVFPILSNFTLVVYDVGLSDEENLEYERYCLCKLIKFPFHLFSPYFRTLKCFGWKPVLIRAHYDSTNFIMWMDASVRYSEPRGILKALDLAEIYGVQQHRASSFISNTFRALPSVFHHFGDSPCAHLAFTQPKFDWGIYHRSPLVKTAFLDSWVSCGLNARCTCPGVGEKRIMQECPSSSGDGRGWRQLGMCMQAQSAVGIILAKLYREQYNVVLTTGDSFIEIGGGTEAKYFEGISKYRN